MNKHTALLSIGAALLCSLFVVNVGHAFQTDRKQDARILMAGEMNGTANLAATQVLTTPNPCTVGGRGRTGAPGKKQCLPGSGAQATDGARYTRQVSNTPSPCTEGGKGRTGAPGTKQCLPGLGEQATDAPIVMAADMNSLAGVPVQASGILFVGGLIVVVGLGLRGLRHHHGHHA